MSRFSQAGKLFELQPLESAAESSQKHVLIKTDDVEVVQFNIPTGRDVPTHAAQGEVLLHCLQGSVAVHIGAVKHMMRVGQLLNAAKGSPISIFGIEDASLLVTIVALKSGSSVELIGD